MGTGINMYTPFNDFYAFDPASNQWAPIANYPGGARYAAMAFSIGNKGYVGCGKDEQLFQGNADFYEYDPLTDVWTKKTNVGTVLRSTGVGFSVGNKGYIGMGFEGYDTRKSDLWEFDPNAGVDGAWTQKQDIPASARWGGVALGIANKGYIVAGWDQSPINDLWSFEPATGTWKQEAIFLTAGRSQGIGFIVGNTGYYGLGQNETSLLSDLWKFTPTVPCDAWTQFPDFPGTKRANPVPFSIGNKGYITTGSGPLGLLNDTWEFDPVAKYWTQRADFPGIARHAAVGFVVNNKAYVGTGINMYTAYDDFFEFDPAQNIWTPKAAYPAGSRYGAMAFSIGNKGYVGGGKDQGLYYGTADFFEYDPAADKWTRKANAGPVLRSSGVGFSVGNKGYIGLGAQDYDTRKKDIWQFDPTITSEGAWIQKADFPGVERYAPYSFTIGHSTFVGSGWNQTLLGDLWVYNATTDTWDAKATPPEMARGAAAAFSIKDKGYVGFGMNDVDYVNTFWEYNSCISAITPTLACVEDQIVFSSSSSCGQTVDNLDPIILPEGATAVVNYTISRNGEVMSSGTGSVSGFTFAQGISSVTYSLPDYPAQTCTFIVEVKDTLPPIVVCPPAQVFCYSPSNSYVLPAMAATDNCGIAGITFSITGATTRSGMGYNASGTFNPGRSYVNWVVKDTAGNTSTCTTEVRVDQPLQVVVPDVTVVFFGGMPNTVYRGFGPSCITLTAYPSGGTRLPGGQYRYKWSNGATTRSITVCPTVFGTNNYMVTVTDSLGCQAYVTKTVKLVDVRCGPRNNEVLICWNRRTQACYTQGQAFLALLFGAQLGSCSPAPAQAAIVSADMPVENVLPAVSVFPNPSNGTFAIQLKNMNATEVRIVDQAGRIVARQAVSGINPTQTIPMQMAKLGKGIFLVQAITSKGIHTCKLVIQ